MKYQNFTLIPGYDPLYGFEIRSEAGVPLNLSNYQFRLEAFDKDGTRIFLKETPTQVDGHWVYFTIPPSEQGVFKEGNYSYRLIAINILGQTRQVYKGYLTVDAPVTQEPPPSGSLTSSDISDFDAAAWEAVQAQVQDAIDDAILEDVYTPQNLVRDNPAFDNGPLIKIKHDELVAQGGGTLTMPAGKFYYKNMNWWHPSVSLQGRGRNATILYLMDGATSSLEVLARGIDPVGTFAPNPEFKGFHLEGRRGSQINIVDGFKFQNPENDPLADYATFGDKGYASGRLIDIEVSGFTGDGIVSEPHRTRLYLNNTRAISNNGHGLNVRSNDPIIGERCGFGSNGKHSVKFTACSGATITGCNIWGNPATRSEDCVAIHFQNCNSVNMVGNVVNDTISIFGGDTQADRGVVIANNILKPHDQLFASDGVTLDNNDNVNCHIRIRGANNVVVEGNAFDPAQTPQGAPVIRFKNLMVVTNSAAAKVSVVISQEADSRPWSSPAKEPFIVDGSSKLIYTIFETTRAIGRTNGTSTFGLPADVEADLRFNLIAKSSLFKNRTVFEGPISFETGWGSRYIDLVDDGANQVLNSPAPIYIFTGAGVTNSTIQLPATVEDGHQVTLVFTKNIQNLNVTCTAPRFIANNVFPRAVTGLTSFTFIYRANLDKWTLISSLPSASLTEAQVTAGAIGVVGYTAQGELVMADSVVTINPKIESVTASTLSGMAPGGLNDGRVLFVSDRKGGLMVRSNGTAWVEMTQGKDRYWIDPKIDHDADSTGATNSTTALTSAFTAALTPAISGVGYGRGKPVIPYPGIYTISPMTLSSHLSIYNRGSTGAVVFKQDHAGISSPTAMFTLQEDGATDNSVLEQPTFTGLVLEGQRTSAQALTHAQAVHGIYAPTAVTGGKAIPALNNCQIVRFSGSCVNFNGWDEYRAVSCRFADSKGWGLSLINSKNGSATMSRYLANLTGGHYLQDCENLSFSQVDITIPAGTAFIGRWAAHIVRGFNISYTQSRIEGPIKIEGTNHDSGSSVRFGRRAIRYDGVHFMVSKNAKDGYAANHSGDNNYIYDAQIEIQDASGISIDNSTVGFGSAAPSAGELSSRPAYFIKFTSQGSQLASDLDLKRGSVTIGSIDFVTREMREGLVPVIMPFTKRPFSHDSGVTWVGPAWDQPVMLKKSTVGRGWVLADGTANLNVADYPLAYLAGGASRTLDDGVTTFTIQEISMPVPSDEYGWYLRAF